jgi:hypothetical protein
VPVVAVDRELHEVEQELLATLQASGMPYPPAKLIAELKRSGRREDLIRAAMWFLIDRGLIQLTPDRKLSPAQ